MARNLAQQASQHWIGLWYRLLVVYVALLTITVFAGGSKKPPVANFTPITESNYRKRVIAIDDFHGKHIFANSIDGENFELMLFRQYLDLLLESGRYTIRVKDERGSAILAKDSNGELGLRYDAKLASLDLKCDFYDEQFLMTGYVTSFEVVSSHGFKAGLNPSIGLYGFGAGLGFTAKKAKMSVSLQASDAYKERALAAVQTDANQSERSFNFNLSYQALANIGYDYFKKTPLSEVSRTALIHGINGLIGQLAPYEWSGRVLSTNGKDLILLNAGRDAGFKDGDEIEVMHYAPQEDPKCRSMPINTNYGKPGAALGRFRIYQSELTHSWAELIQRNSSAPLMTGSKVRWARPAPRDEGQLAR
jgi:hypothetical protein